MGARISPAAVVLASMATLFAVGLVGCGLDGQGLLAVDGGRSGSPSTGMDTSTTDDDDAMVTSPDDADPVSGDDATTPGPPDAMPQASDAGAGLDAAPDAPPPPPVTCASCTAQMCPTQLAACGKGSDCLNYRDCAYACAFSGSGGSSCTSACVTKYPGGKSAFGSLTVCDIGCGGSCVAQLAVSSP